MRILFDTGAQSSFINEEISEKLNLPAVRKERRFIQTFEDKNAEPRVLNVVQVEIKSVLQKIYMVKINWNDALPETIITEWQNNLENVNVINSLKLERHYLKMFDLKGFEIIELHGFSGASLKAHTCVIYIRFKLKDGSSCANFVASKTKINHIERISLTIPKLELMACVLLNQLMFSV